MNPKDLDDAVTAMETLTACWEEYVTALNDGTPTERLRMFRWSVSTAAGNIVDKGIVARAIRTLADQAALTDADTERLVAHGEHLKDLEENR